MKKKVLYAAAFLFIAWAATSCTALEDCKFCRTVTTDNSTGDITQGPEAEYCGAALLAIEAKGPTTVLNSTTVWECR